MAQPGEEVVYVIRGVLEHQVESESPATVKAGEVLFVPAEAIWVVRTSAAATRREFATYVAKKGRPLVISAK